MLRRDVVRSVIHLQPLKCFSIYLLCHWLAEMLSIGRGDSFYERHMVYSVQVKSETETEETSRKSESKHAWRLSIKQTTKVPCSDVSFCLELASCMESPAPGPHPACVEANPTHPTSTPHSPILNPTHTSVLPSFAYTITQIPFHFFYSSIAIVIFDFAS